MKILTIGFNQPPEYNAKQIEEDSVSHFHEFQEESGKYENCQDTLWLACAVGHLHYQQNCGGRQTSPPPVTRNIVLQIGQTYPPPE